ncbi:MAG: PIN domain nuclease [Chryseobacterium sp.]|nr:MAG: PIN domain nuclease [Chryseobacterium sp.]
MKYLLDTHTLLWFFEGNSNLSDDARSAIENADNICFVSIASIWEIAIKISLGKLTLEISLNDLKSEILKNDFQLVPIEFDHIVELSNLEIIHRDPFDRIIISQAVCENCTIISKDSNFNQYKNLKLLW